MFPPRSRFSFVTIAFLMACAVFSALPGKALAVPTATASATASPTASASPTATATATPTPATRLGNISTRSLVDVGDNALIAGFIVTGTQQKKVLVCGIGPSLPFATEKKLADPTLELRDGTGALINSNDNWQDSPDKQAIFNTGIPLEGLESGIVATLTAKGATYTAILRGVNGGTGIGVVEVYDLDSLTTDSNLANISTRGLVSTGDSAMIAGTIVVGPMMQDVIIRALGPSLSIVNKLADPTLELRGANGELIQSNDNWRENNPNSQAIFDSGVAPTDPHESAIKATLSPKFNYTAIVRGVGAADTGSEKPPPTVTRTQSGSGNTVEVQHVQFARPPVGGTFRLIFTRPLVIMSGQPGDKAALGDSITVPWSATAADIKAAILASLSFYKYDQNNNLTAGPGDFHTLFDSGGGLGIAGNEGSRREPVITGSVPDFTIQYGTLTTGAVGIRNPWISGLPLVQIDDSSIIYDGGIAVVEIYALQ
jgi:hypothetical protein